MATCNAFAVDSVAQEVVEADTDLLTAQWTVNILHRQQWDKNTFLRFLEETHAIVPGSVDILRGEEIDERLYGLECSQIAPLSPGLVKMRSLDLSQLAAQGNYDILVAEGKTSADDIRCVNNKGKRECELAVKSCSIGAFLDPFIFSCHGVIKSDQWRRTKNASSTRICAKFDFLKDSLNVEMDLGHSAHSSKRRMEYSFAMMKKHYLVTRDAVAQTNNIFFYYETPPKIWKQENRQNRNSESKTDAMSWDRDTGIPGLCDVYPGFCSVIKIEVGEESYPEFEDWKAKMELGRFKLWWGPVRTVESDTGQRLLKHILDDQGSTWSMKCLFSLGYKATDHLSNADIEELHAYEKQHPRSFAKAVQKLVYSKLVKYPIVNVMEAFREIWCSLLAKEPPEENVEELTISGDIAAIRQVLVTPSAICYLPPEPCEMNRVVRHFKPENFAKVSFCDEDENKLCAMSQRCLEKPVQGIKSILRRGIFSDSRHFVYLGSSNSQLRQHSCWFYASTRCESVHEIRKWMGNLSGIRCVALYVARLGQFFSTSQPTVTLSPTVVEDVDDITTINPKGATYCFTDGVGKISAKLASEVAKAMKLHHVPSAYQIRMAGIKGVLAIDPTFGDCRRVQVRPSMKKFPSDQYGLEVTQTSKPIVLHLNRQVVSLLSGAGISDEVFLELEEDYLLELAGMFLSETQAARYLSACRLGFNIQDLQREGYQFLLDPYFRSLLTAKYKGCLWELREKARIPISPDKGRLMIGVVDETGTLHYGQVFVQYSTHILCPQKKTTVLTGHVVITKNPCFHPGDLRKFQAVDCPQLHHMVDVVVFPSVGPRPHPNEISGSDLDGDMYWVCWHDKLIPVRENCVPMEFPQAARSVLHHDPTEEDVINYIGEYVKHDHIGLIANAHVVFADREGVDSEKCIQLARLHSDAVDFPKTGKYPRMDPELRPKRYPDFMGKNRVLTYHSKGILGKLFRLCQVLPRFDATIGPVAPSNVCQGNPQLYTEAEEAYADYANELEQLLSVYGLKEETDLVTGSAQMFQRKGTQKNTSYERMNVARRQFHHLQERMSSVFNPCSEMQRRAKALVWAEVAKTKQFQSFAWLPGLVSIKTQTNYLPVNIKTPVMKNANLLSGVVEKIEHSITTRSHRRQDERPQQKELLDRLETFLRNNTGNKLHLVPVHLVGINLWSGLSIGQTIMAHLERSVDADFPTDMELLQRCERILTSHHADIHKNETTHFENVTLKGSNLHFECTPDVSRSRSMQKWELGTSPNVHEISHQLSNLHIESTPDTSRENTMQKVILTTSHKVLDLSRQLSSLFERYPFVNKTAQILAEWAEMEKLLVHNPSFDVLDILALLLPLVESENPMPCIKEWRSACGEDTEETPLALVKTLSKPNTSVSDPSVAQCGREPVVDSADDTDSLTYDLRIKDIGDSMDIDVNVAANSAGLLIGFFMFYSKKKNLVEARYKATKIGSSSIPSTPEPILKRYTPAAVSVLHMSMMGSCNLLLTSQSVTRILGTEVASVGDLERRLHALSEETHVKLWADEQHLRCCIERRTGCSIFIHKDTYKEIPIFTLEAVGDRPSQDDLDREMRQLERISLTRPDQDLQNPYAPDSFLGLFEGSASQNDLINLCEYHGPRYKKTKSSEKQLKVPILNACPTKSASNDLFRSMWRKQMDMLRDSYDPDYLGDLRIIARFGRSLYRVLGRDPGLITIEDLNRECNDESKRWSQRKKDDGEPSRINRGNFVQPVSHSGPQEIIYNRSATTRPRLDRPYRGRGRASFTSTNYGQPSHLEGFEPCRMNFPFGVRGQVRHIRSLEPCGMNVPYRGRGQLRDMGNLEPCGMNVPYRGRGQLRDMGNLEPCGMNVPYRGRGQLRDMGNLEPCGMNVPYRGRGQLRDMGNLEPCGMNVPYRGRGQLRDMGNLEPCGMNLPYRGRGRATFASANFDRGRRIDSCTPYGAHLPFKGHTNSYIADSPRNTNIWPMFYPEDITRPQIQLFLEEEGFVESDREGLTICNASMSSERLHEGEFLFNGQLECIKFRQKSQRWCSVAIHALQAAGPRHASAYDVRIQIQSLQNIPKESMAQYEAFTHPKEPILYYKESPVAGSSTRHSPGSADESNARPSLNLTKDLPEIGVHRDYTQKIKFVRQKEVVKYKLNKLGGHHRYNHFTDHVEFHVSRVQEYGRPHPDGSWGIKYEPKDEVILVLPSHGFPLLNETDEWDDIGSQLMEMSLKFSHAIARRQ